MTEYSHPVNTCLDIGHIYMDVLAVRCSHLEAIKLEGRVWRDRSDGDTEVIAERSVEFGPFDDAGTIGAAVLRMIADLTPILQTAKAL
uniref:Uncharacterized protein n=1 Tax=uncultured prokaryote TaxID=198431 RepID=A0A0H5Q5W0_9ZZZZ|nr:hypothetical protein [uncultured prokaryote]